MAEPTTAPSQDINALAKSKGINDQQLTQNINEFLSSYAAPASTRKRDTLEDRYRIDPGAPLPEYNNKSARAFAAVDLQDARRQIYALVCTPGTVQRHRALERMKKISHPNLLTVYAYGVIELSTDEERFVIFQSRPPGKKLSELLRTTTNPLNEAFITKVIIAPIVSAINALGEAGLSHGSIHPDNIFYSDQPVLGDCVSEACGLSQPFYFEPVERMQALQSAKGEGNITHDYYALAILGLYLMYGEKHFEGFTPEMLAKRILRQGPYNTLMRNKEPSDSFSDFLRGMLSNNPNDRWNARHLKGWLEGKKLNVMLPPAPAEASRPFEFNTIQAHSRRELANMFFVDWAQFQGVMQTDALSQWISISLRNKELSETIKRIKQAIANINNKQEIQISEQLMRILLLLDAVGPVRIQSLAFHIDGMDSLCSELFATKAQNELKLLAKYIEQSMINYWTDTQHNSPNYVMPDAVNAITVRLDKLRLFIRSTGWGFGLERMQYEMHPETPCMSPLFVRWHVTTLPALLTRLDQLAPRLAREQDPIDRHIAAFIAHKLGIIHDVKLHELTIYPSLASDNAIMALKFIALAQQRCSNMQFPGLAHWLALRIIPALEILHSKSLKSKVRSVLLNYAKAGRIDLMSQIITDSNYAEVDSGGFERAIQTFQRNNEAMTVYRKESTIDTYSHWLGCQIAKGMAYIVLALMLYKFWSEQ